MAVNHLLSRLLAVTLALTLLSPVMRDGGRQPVEVHSLHMPLTNQALTLPVQCVGFALAGDDWRIFSQLPAATISHVFFSKKKRSDRGQKLSPLITPMINTPPS